MNLGKWYWFHSLKEVCSAVLQRHPLVTQFPEVSSAQFTIPVPVQQGKPPLEKGGEERKRGEREGRERGGGEGKGMERGDKEREEM